jgi:uncharacterized hydrophobic protein (TIGR00341 family)
MSSRLVEVIVADADVVLTHSLLEACSARLWQETVPSGREKFSAIVLSHEVETLLNRLTEALAGREAFSAIVLELQAIVPPLVEPEVAGAPVGKPIREPTAIEKFLSRDRRSTDEIYDDVVDSIALTPEFLLTVVLSALIAALGMRSGQTAIVIGAMVIAPLLGPTLSLALAGTVGNGALAWRAARTLAVGALCVLIFTVLLSLMIEYDPATPELHSRTVVHLADIALALASGAAGVLALNKGASASLVGVMIAVALVPPLSAAGLYFGHGYFELGLRGLFLFANNLVCINIAGIAAFLIQGLPPKRWRITLGVLATWVAVLLLFMAMITGRIVLGIAWTGDIV